MKKIVKIRPELSPHQAVKSVRGRGPRERLRATARSGLWADLTADVHGLGDTEASLAAEDI